ncbi:MAG: hypothetical protein EOP22_16795 [Hyphomicrobiales bacterium]|nr:MAG: hypothetical protein EOP22_16795 [Hyphomicrobiales bacterium]
MDKLDFKKLMRPFWSPPRGAFEIVDVPELSFVMIDGRGDPNGEAFQAALGWLYPVSYGLKFASKAAGRDYGVGPLEGLWWTPDPGRFAEASRSDWQWTAMIMQPDWIDAAMFDAAVAKAAAKQRQAAPATLRLERLKEGLSVQTLHIGAYRDEAPTIAAMHGEFIPQNGLAETGKHHEIYLSDARRVAPEKLRTILRQPVRRL